MAGGGDAPLRGAQPWAHDRGLAARPQRQPTGRLGGGNPVHQVGPTPDHGVQLAVDSVDFLPQAVETGRIHEAGDPVRQRRYYVPSLRVKANKALKCLHSAGEALIETPVEFEPTGFSAPLTS